MFSNFVEKKHQKQESGVQLLARLTSHLDLSSIDPDVFSKPTSGLSHPGQGYSSSGRVIEIYGAEGVGKTELALHYVARMCLPAQWRGHCLNGLGARVLFIDTEFKFSVLRLAIVIEKQIESILSKLKHGAAQAAAAQNMSACKTSKYKTQVINAPVLDTSESTESTHHTPKCSTSTHVATNNTPIHSPLPTPTTGSLRLAGDKSSSYHLTCYIDRSSVVGNNGQHRASSGAGASHEVSVPDHGQDKPSAVEMTCSLPDMEDLVLETLGRVQVLQVGSTDQLLISLLSLEHTLSTDSTVSLVVIDTISAFYWADQVGDISNNTEHRMLPITNFISKYASDYGTTFLVIKSALINKRKTWNEDSLRTGISTKTSEGSGSSCTFTGWDKTVPDHVEFLGKSWFQLSKKRIMLSQELDARGRVQRWAWSPDWSSCKPFVLSDDGFQFVPGFQSNTSSTS